MPRCWRSLPCTADMSSFFQRCPGDMHFKITLRYSFLRFLQTVWLFKSRWKHGCSRVTSSVYSSWSGSKKRGPRSTIYSDPEAAKYVWGSASEIMTNGVGSWDLRMQRQKRSQKHSSRKDRLPLVWWSSLRVLARTWRYGPKIWKSAPQTIAWGVLWRFMLQAYLEHRNPGWTSNL